MPNVPATIVTQDAFDATLARIDLNPISEHEFERLYSLIFHCVSARFTIKESGASGDTLLSMSKWVDITRNFVIVVRISISPANMKELIDIVYEIIKEEEQSISVVIENYPNQVVVLQDRVLGSGENDVLTSYGLNLSSE